MARQMYYPPSGWRYGFPKRYEPKPHESLADTLVRNGYPRRFADFAAKYTRFWTPKEEGRAQRDEQR